MPKKSASDEAAEAIKQFRNVGGVNVKAYRPTPDGWVELQVEFRKGGRRLWLRF